MHAQYQKHDVSPTPPAQPQVNGASQNSVHEAPNAASIDDLISSASKQAESNPIRAQPSPQPPTKAEASVSESVQPAAPPQSTSQNDVGEEKNAKKEKDKPKTSRLVYSDNDTSPEEKMAMLAKYSFTPEQRSIMA